MPLDNPGPRAVRCSLGVGMRALDPKRGLFPISVAAELVGVEPRVLRFYEQAGLIKPRRSDGNRRLYSMEDIELLEYVHYMTHVRRVNLAGVKTILAMLSKLPSEIRQQEISLAEQAIEKLDQTALSFDRLLEGEKEIQFDGFEPEEPEEE
jgi:MerR family transcriptional regulator/heat shock protein HspR